MFPKRYITMKVWIIMYDAADGGEEVLTSNYKGTCIIVNFSWNTDNISWKSQIRSDFLCLNKQLEGSKGKRGLPKSDLILGLFNLSFFFNSADKEMRWLVRNFRNVFICINTNMLLINFKRNFANKIYSRKELSGRAKYKTTGTHWSMLEEKHMAAQQSILVKWWFGSMSSTTCQDNNLS